MGTERICPSCHQPLAPDAPQGLCPECLMQAGFGTGVAPEPGGPTSQPAFTPPPVAEMAKLFPHLEIVELLGRGGMGAVYKARQPALDRWVALKILPPQSTSRPGFAERFNREARALARLNHANIVTVYDFGQAGNMPYFVMEYVEGVTLRRLVQERRLTPREALRIVPQICEALQFAHDEGIVHRDIKPENILLDKKGRVKIADFGIAKIVTGEQPEKTITQDQAIGTPHYMAPEQMEKPQLVDHRADIYSLGVVLYEMLTGEVPGAKIQPPSKKVQLDVRIDEIVMRALEQEPELRYQTAADFRTEVETFATTPLSRSSGRQSAPSEGQSRLTSAATTPPHFTRTAIVGSLLAILCVFDFIKIVMVMSSRPGIFSTPYGWLLIFLGQSHLYLLAIGTTILGWAAVSQIRRAAGRLYGMWLAIFDGLLFPLLALDAFIFYVLHSLTGNVFSGGYLAIALLISFVFDWRIAWWVWRKVNGQSAHGTLATASTPRPWWKNWRWQLAIAVVVAVIIRAYFLQPFSAQTDAAAPEIPRGSRFFVWKLVRHFSPGDLIAYNREGQVNVSRVTESGKKMALVNRNNEGVFGIPRSDVIGKVISIYWRGSDQSASSFYIGQACFPKGDSIEITSVNRSKDRIIVKGRYQLVSADNAQLALYITATNNIGPVRTDPKQNLQISKGTGDFELIHPNPHPGYPHVNMYSTNGQSFAGVYFGTKEEAAVTRNFDLGCLEPADGSAITSGPANVIVEPAGLALESFDDNRWQASVPFRNTGSVASTAVSVLFYAGSPHGRLISKHTVGPISPGRTWTEGNLSFELTEYETEVFAVIDPDNVLKRPAGSVEWVLKATVNRTPKSQTRRVLEGSTSFGPVIERVLLASSEKTWLQGLDFESGTLLTAKVEELSSDELRRKWATDHGDSLLARNRGGDKWELGSVQTKLALLPQEQWESASPLDLRRALDATDMEVGSGWRFQAIRADSAKLWAFALQTGSGAIGILQITGFTNNPASVKIRYKLVQTNNESASSAAPVAVKRLSGGEFSQDFQTSLPLTSSGQFSLGNANGKIEITGWDRNEVLIKAVKRGKEREAVEATKIDVDSTTDHVSVHTRVPQKRIGWGNENVTVDYTIQVPRAARLEKIVNAKGSVVIEGVTGDITASAANGSMRVNGAKGNLKLSTSNGQIVAEPASLGGRQLVFLDTSNGSISLALPSDTDATVTAAATNGSITSEFPALTVKKDFPTGNHLNGTLGTGSANVNATTVNGSISIRRATSREGW